MARGRTGKDVAGGSDRGDALRLTADFVDRSGLAPRSHTVDINEPVCQRAGTRAEGEACGVDPYLCAPGLTCLGNVCRRLCGTVLPECTTGTCSALGGGFDGGTYGACTP